MNAAEKLRQEMEQNAPFTKEEFIDVISSRIRKSGNASFVCDKHIGTTRLDGFDAIARRDEQTAVNYARSEGFNVHESYNSYGVRRIVFTL